MVCIKKKKKIQNKTIEYKLTKFSPKTAAREMAGKFILRFLVFTFI